MPNDYLTGVKKGSLWALKATEELCLPADKDNAIMLYSTTILFGLCSQTWSCLKSCGIGQVVIVHFHPVTGRLQMLAFIMVDVIQPHG